MRDSAPMAAARELRMTADVMTLVTLGDSDVRMVALIDLTVVQGELRTVGVRLPPGYELTGISGSSLETSDVQRRRRDADDRRRDGAPPPVADEPRAAARRRIVHARHRAS